MFFSERKREREDLSSRGGRTSKLTHVQAAGDDVASRRRGGDSSVNAPPPPRGGHRIDEEKDDDDDDEIVFVVRFRREIGRRRRHGVRDVRAGAFVLLARRAVDNQ